MGVVAGLKALTLKTLYPILSDELHKSVVYGKVYMKIV